MAAGLKMTPETYMAYAYLKAGSIFLLILPALHVFPLLAILLVLLGVMVYYKETRKAEELVREKETMPLLPYRTLPGRSCSDKSATHYGSV